MPLENKDFVLVLSCSVATHRTFVNPFVHLAEEALAQDLAHDDVVSGNSVFLCAQVQDFLSVKS